MSQKNMCRIHESAACEPRSPGLDLLNIGYLLIVSVLATFVFIFLLGNVLATFDALACRLGPPTPDRSKGRAFGHDNDNGEAISSDINLPEAAGALSRYLNPQDATLQDFPPQDNLTQAALTYDLDQGEWNNWWNLYKLEHSPRAQQGLEDSGHDESNDDDGNESDDDTDEEVEVIV